MSELLNRDAEILFDDPAPLQKEPPVSSQKEVSPLLKRLALVLTFILIIFAMFAVTPPLAKQIAYSWNIGSERAKAEAAKQFLADNPMGLQRIAWVANAVAPSVVGIQTITIRHPEESYGSRRRSASGTSDEVDTGVGSGVIVDAQGYILTNYHVIADAVDIQVQMSDGRTVEAEVVGQDRSIDLAVLRIEMGDLETIEWGDSRKVTLGEQVVAIGSPYGLQQTVTSGIISTTERFSPFIPMMQGMRRGQRPVVQKYIQTDAAVNPGNSGGALVDMNGKLIGICTAIFATEVGGNTGISFAIPSFTAKLIYEEIVSQGEVKHGWIGVYPENVSPAVAQQMNRQKLTGAVVRRFFDRSPASIAGLQRGDVIVRWGETEITDPLHLTHLVLLTKPGTKETVEVFREGALLTFEITVGERPRDL